MLKRQLLLPIELWGLYLIGHLVVKSHQFPKPVQSAYPIYVRRVFIKTQAKNIIAIPITAAVTTALALLKDSGLVPLISIYRPPKISINPPTIGVTQKKIKLIILTIKTKMWQN